MSVYIVRHIETKEIHGLVWGTLDQIWDIVDSEFDPYGFEFAKVPCGGLLTDEASGKGQRYPTLADWEAWEASEDEGAPEPSFDWGRFREDDLLHEKLSHQKNLRWRSFDSATDGHGMVARIYANIERNRQEKANAAAAGEAA